MWTSSSTLPCILVLTLTHLPGFYTQFETHVQLPAPAVAAHTDVVINTRGKADLIAKYVKQPRIQPSTHFLLSPPGLQEPTLPSFRDPLSFVTSARGRWTATPFLFPPISHPPFFPSSFCSSMASCSGSISGECLLFSSKNSLLLSEYLEDLTFHYHWCLRNHLNNHFLEEAPTSVCSHFLVIQL